MAREEFDDLTPEEMAAFEKQIDPDEGVSEQYQWDETFQRTVMGMLLNDRWFATQGRDLINPNYFTDEVHRLLCSVLFSYLDKYKTIPTKLVVGEEVRNAVQSKDTKVRYHFLSETNAVYESFTPGIETRDYLIDKITNFAKLMALKSAFNKCLALIKKEPDSEDTWTKIQSQLREALLVDRNFEMGLDYFQTFEERYERMKAATEAMEQFTSGFDAIDENLLGGGPHRGELYSWIGLSGAGKSLMLVTAAVRNICKLGKRVLYISLEMDEDKIAERFDAQIANLNINELAAQEELVKKAMQENLDHFDDPRLLVIKQFPPGTLTVNTLRAYMQQTQMLGFKPDLVIVDYIGEMKDYPDMPTWESRQKVVRDLRGLAIEEQVCIYTAMQPNKDAREAQKKDGLGSGVIDDTNLADSFGQIRPLDGCWSINQMQAEKEAGIARVFVIKHRHGKSRFTFHVQYDKNTLAIKQITGTEYDKIWKQYTFTKKITTSDIESQADSRLQDKTKKYFQRDMGPDDEPDGPAPPLDDPDAPDAPTPVGR
jgi:replicative DNA helicase